MEKENEKSAFDALQGSFNDRLVQVNVMEKGNEKTAFDALQGSIDDRLVKYSLYIEALFSFIWLASSQ